MEWSGRAVRIRSESNGSPIGQSARRASPAPAADPNQRGGGLANRSDDSLVRDVPSGGLDANRGEGTPDLACNGAFESLGADAFDVPRFTSETARDVPSEHSKGAVVLEPCRVAYPPLRAPEEVRDHSPKRRAPDRDGSPDPRHEFAALLGTGADTHRDSPGDAGTRRALG